MPTNTSNRETVELSLPWPANELKPNARPHYMAKARAAKKARRDACLVTLGALKGWTPPWQSVVLHWDFRPKTRNVPDGDNAEASVKAYRDGIADALGIDDSKFTTTRTIGEPVKGGAVFVTIRCE